ncbi:MAG TPA: hypothetical protein VFM36_14140 [Thermoanaerobaculia bacterium]|nr:hypothetical protein [Thermoanaerobaculia bacterium]
MTLPFILLLAFTSWSPVGPERASVTAIHAGASTLAGTAEGRLFALDAQNAWSETATLDHRPVTNIAEGAGATWVLAGDSLYRSGRLALDDVRSFALSPSNGQVIYAATSSAVLFSSDGGISWVRRPGGARSIDVDARDSAFVWAVRANGVVEKSIDAGVTWTPMTIDGAIERIDAHPRRAAAAFATGANGLGFRTTDGQRWTRLYYLTGELTFDPQKDDHFFAVDSAGRLFHSDDDGDWLDVVHGGPILSLSFAADGSLLAGFREDGVMRSDDGGNNWSPHRHGLLAAQIHSLAASLDGAVAYAGSVSSMFRTTNRGTSWDPVFTLRLLPGPFSAIAIDDNDPNRVWIAAGISAWFSGDGGVRFNRLFWAPDREPQTIVDMAFDPLDARAVYVLMSQSFFRLHTEPLQLAELTPSGGPFAAMAVDGGSIWVGGSRLLQSTDGGRTWIDRSPPLSGSITALHAFRGGVVAGTSSGDVIFNGVTSNLGSGPIKDIASDGTTIYVAANRVHASTDGAHWQNAGELTDVTALTSGSLRMAGTAGSGVWVGTRQNSRRRAAGR